MTDTNPLVEQATISHFGGRKLPVSGARSAGTQNDPGALAFVAALGVVLAGVILRIIAGSKAPNAANPRLR